MSQATFFGRIGSWLRVGRSADDVLPLDKPVYESAVERVQTSRLKLWRPWAKRDAAIAGLQQGFTTLTDLMTTIRENLERQGRRQDEMLSYMAHLPEIVQAFPESHRLQGETLRTIGQQLQQQIVQQNRLAEILTKVCEADTDQKQLLESLHEKMQTSSQQNEAISQNLWQVGSAMKHIGQTTESSSQVLRQMRDNLEVRHGEMERVIQRQNTRFTVLAAVAVVLATSALAAVSLVGYMLLKPPAM